MARGGRARGRLASRSLALAAFALGASAACAWLDRGLGLPAAAAQGEAEEEAMVDLGPGFHHDIDETSLSVGTFHACALHQGGGRGADSPGGTAVCWGKAGRARDEVPEGEEFVQISVGDFQSCGVNVHQKLRCWGEFVKGGERMAATDYVQVSVGPMHSCAVTKDGLVDCFGGNAHSRPPRDDDRYVQVSVGMPHTCAIRTDGTLRCWGEDYYGTNAVPKGQFVQVSASASGHACAIRAKDNHVVCWGLDHDGALEAPKDEAFLQVTSGRHFTCGLSETTGLVRCWGNTDSLSRNAPPATMQFMEISAGGGGMCGITGMDAAVGLTGESADEQLRVLCWGQDTAVQPEHMPAPDALRPPAAW